MKITVFGASGKTGIEVVKQALDKGLEVKAFVRDKEKLKISDPKLKIVQGDILQAGSVNQAVEGVDAVLSTLGSNMPILAEGTKNIINSMKKHKVNRIIIESSFPMSGSTEGMEYLKKAGMTNEQIASFKPILDDKASQEKETRESGLSWTIIWPLGLTDGEKTGKYRLGEKLDVKPGDTISRADVADFMLKQLERDEWLNKTVTIAY